jgi:hypothetical protein
MDSSEPAEILTLPKMIAINRNPDDQWRTEWAFGTADWLGYIALRVLTMSHKVWDLDSMELHELAVDLYLRSTRYRDFAGNFQAIWFLQHIWDVPFPIALPTYANGSLRCLANVEPMLSLNRLLKALFEFMKSIRVFMRTAVLHRRQHRHETEFWVRCPSVHVSVYNILETLMEHFFDMDVTPVEDREYNSLGRDLTRFQFVTNLLQPRASFQHLEWDFSMMSDLYETIFEEGAFYNLTTWINEGSLSDPTATSYGFPVADNPEFPRVQSPKLSSAKLHLGVIEEELI